MFKVEQETAWRMYECGNGSRWTSVLHDVYGQVCNFSGCNCNTRIKLVNITTDRNQASAWFQRPKERT